MILWILAVVLVAAVAAVGYQRGGVRAAVSTVGLIISAFLVLPLGKLIRPLMPKIGIVHPVLIEFAAPVIVLVLLMIIFKCCAIPVHRKVELYYKYNVPDTLRMLWERLDKRLGACVGLINGFIYLIMLSVLIYSVGYATVQIAPGDNEPIYIKAVNALGRGMQENKMVRAISPFAPAKELYYDACDTLGIIINNPLIQNRLSRYPALLTLADRQEYQDLGDKSFQQAWAGKPAVTELIKHEKLAPAVANLELYDVTLAAVAPDIKDLNTYLVSGKSRYDEEKILGRWDFDARSTVTLARKKPGVSSVELNKLRRTLANNFAKAKLTATLDKKVIIRSGKNTYEGTWKNDGSSQYKINVKEGDKKREGIALIEGNRMYLSRDGFNLIFEK